MTTREEIITFAKQHLKKDVVYYRDGAELEWDDIKDLYEAAQRQAYERAAALCESEYEVMGGFASTFDTPFQCAEAIRALIERDGK